MTDLSLTGRAWRLADLLDGLVDLGPDRDHVGDRQIVAVVADTRTLVPGTLFLARQGVEIHGLSFAEEAKRRGAVAILGETTDIWPVEAIQDLRGRLGLPIIPVADLSAKVSEIADRFYGSPSQRLEVFGVTGTYGKTSIGHYLAEALAPEFSCGVIGSIGSGFPHDLQPAPLADLDAISLQWMLEDLRLRGAKGVAMDVSSLALCHCCVSAVRFSHAVFTNLTRDHQGHHGDMAEYGAATKRLFSSPGLDWAVLNFDDPFAEEILAGLWPSVKVAAYSLRSHASPPPRCDLWLRAHSIEMRPRGLRLVVDCGDGDEQERAELELGLIGLFSAANVLAMLAVMRSRGVALDRAARELVQVRGVPGRMECFGTPETPLVVVDVARTPDALEKALTNLRLHRCRRIITVVGCGSDLDRSKRSLVGAIAGRLSDRVILTDDNPRHESGEVIIGDILAGLSNPDSITVERQRGLAIRLAITLAGVGDAVLVAGKGHETMQDMGDLKVHFSDRAQVVEALREWREGHH